ncbi:competence protein ComEC [Rheinheimera pacifica]|uniref:DNA internalization-related competence protein ComEC/Rec2 n=1 Tax=Rheinheimera pacifica TaxID=173990 RepID=UPI0021682E3F|nr:DNA internalization-related competence protein ComEC/Rec2 [Rheinheimera pacifica]MCS4307205.1 competence protein ComEC [Rheinheimera pacifica]
MKSFCIGVLTGSLLSLFLPIVPPFFTVFLLLPLTVLLLAVRYRFCAGLAAFICCWIIQFAGYQTEQQHILNYSEPLQGTIVGIPKQYAEYSQFTLQLENNRATGYQIQLNWSQPPVLLQEGQRWRLSARLRPVAGSANPAGVNREAQALLQGVLAQGAVLSGSDTQLLPHKVTVRQRLIAQLQQATENLDSAPLLLALTVGQRQFSPALWQGLQQSGLAHLLAISGLHIGLVFGWSFCLLRIMPWPLRYLAWRQGMALTGALLTAFAYAWLAGFAIPTIRAAFALLLMVLAWLQYRRLSYSHYWLLLTAVLLLAQPFFVLSKSFWLSVLAVAVIFTVLWLQPRYSKHWRSKFYLFLRFHFYLALLMSLLSVLLFDGSSVLALVSNVLWVPWCSLLAIPLLFISLVVELLQLPGSSVLWQLTDIVFQPLLWWLNWAAVQSNSWWALPDQHWLLIGSLLIVCLLFLVSYRRIFLYLGVVLMLPLILAFTRPVQWQLHLIDVGQGLAVLLQYGQRGLLYDAGPRYGQHSATASQVLPYLRQRGVRQLDYLILSHDDSDHTGDWQLLTTFYPQVQIYTDINNINKAQPCSTIPQQYLAARLQMLDTGGDFGNKNDSSCVLLIQLYGWQILLPGDIGARVEQQLIARYPQLSANVLVLSHHGSNSSSHFSFLHQLAPQLALNSASLYNRHRHPAGAVQQRLQMLDIPLYNTAHGGAIRLDISEQALHVHEYRTQRIPFWLQKPVGNAETLLTTR